MCGETYDELTVGHLGSAKMYRTPLQDALDPLQEALDHFTVYTGPLLQGLPKAGALQLVYIYKEKCKTVVCKVLP